MTTLYCPPKYYRSAAVIIAAKMSNFTLAVKHMQNNSDDLMRLEGKNEAGDIVLLKEPFDILKHVSSPSLLGKDMQSAVFDWMSWVYSSVIPAVGTWVYPCLGVTLCKQEELELAKQMIHSHFDKINALLLDQTFIIGEEITLADIVTATGVMLVFQHVMDAKERSNYPAFMRWFNTIVKNPAFSAAVPYFQWCTTPLTPNMNRYKELHDGSKHGNKQDASSKKQQAKKEKQKPAEAQETKKSEAAKVEPEPSQPVEPKDPFLSFPAGTFIMDEWKRTYSNNDIRTVALPYFYEKFDAEHYSIWYCSYNYNEDLAMTFMTSNLIGGMFQRLEKMRKYAFGSMCIFGVNHNNKISGLWIWRGQDLAFTHSVNLQVDYESYTWKKLDFNAPETRTLIEQYFTQEFAPEMNFCSGKIYK